VSWGLRRGRRQPQAARTERQVGRPETAHPHGVKGSGMAGPSDALKSPWSPLAIRPWFVTVRVDVRFLGKSNDYDKWSGRFDQVKSGQVRSGQVRSVRFGLATSQV
jgi:hypothetical protein